VEHVQLLKIFMVGALLQNGQDAAVVIVSRTTRHERSRGQIGYVVCRPGQALWCRDKSSSKQVTSQIGTGYAIDSTAKWPPLPQSTV
jgi:hypothetical protein